MSTSFKCITGADPAPDLALYDPVALRSIEEAAAASLGPHVLMQRAGLAIAQFVMAHVPHAQKIWIPCGPGNNGGDGLEVALHLRQWGKQPLVSMLRPDVALPADAALSLRRAQQAGVDFVDGIPAEWDGCVDALFGIGSSRPLEADAIRWVHRMNAHEAPTLAVDVPTGLNAITGHGDSEFVRARSTLTLLGAKPGLFTANGRDACGSIWLHSLGIESTQEPHALLNTGLDAGPRIHNTHKGSYGDVAVVGGAHGMTGAGILAALGALHSGAGRVYMALLDELGPRTLPDAPELLLRSIESLDFSLLTVVAGCGGGAAIEAELPRILSTTKHLVLDADALNAIANSQELIALLRHRAPHTTVATPHPLEAARLLHTSTADIQADRLQAAQKLARQLHCTIVLKGSGTVIASPAELPRINTTGNARLATGGTGDVLAGMTGAYMAAGATAHQAARSAVYAHGRAADNWPADRHLTAAALARSL